MFASSGLIAECNGSLPGFNDQIISLPSFFLSLSLFLPPLFFSFCLSNPHTECNARTVLNPSLSFISLCLSRYLAYFLIIRVHFRPPNSMHG